MDPPNFKILTPAQKEYILRLYYIIYSLGAAVSRLSFTNYLEMISGGNFETSSLKLITAEKR